MTATGILSITCLVASSGISGAGLVTEPFKPVPIRLTVDQLPEPDEKESANKRPEVVKVPEKAALEAPEGFTVEVYAEQLPNARWLALTPDGDVLLARSKDDVILLLRDTDGDGKPDKNEPFADKSNALHMPFGMAFAGDYFYVGNTDAVRRYAWKRTTQTGGGRGGDHQAARQGV